ncbi:MAG: T9SS type A sorting domain-containing protein [Bacteroidetes bacterium]|nr:T9SS type A sorting domain-containing protein [Bacteroidota bacterium]MBU1117134.1 T9SS type A sorting domain-containing protein [Bacteroidota bacterium]MBU1796816.1 T9SS type A sorting domain-containing protein [Bacteroidota bacterium]
MKHQIKVSVFIASAIISFFLFNDDLSERVDLLKQKSELGSKDNPIKRAEFEFRMLKSPTTGEIPKGIRSKELEFVKSIGSANERRLNKGAKIQSLDFASRGPINRGGRVRALGIDVRSTSANSVIIAAGVSGGIWRSTNNGNTWIQTSLPSQINSATCIAQDLRSGHQDTWYVGTGESYGNSARGGSASYLGNGIFKSTDNGLSWSLLASTSSNTPHSFDNAFDLVHNIAVNPTTGTIYAAAINTIMSSKDGGNSWESELSSPTSSTFSDVVATSAGVVYASINSSAQDAGIWKTSNDGINWINITPTGFPSVYNRVVIAVAPSNQNKIYLLANTVGSGKDGHSFWASNDGGSTWSNYSNNLPDTKDPVAGYSSQGNYNMVIAVKPDDPNFVVFGGTNLHRSTNGMTTKLVNTFANWIGGYSVANNIDQYTNHHPDQHALVFAPFDSKMLFCGDDGGVQVTTDISKSTVAWSDKNNGFITSQFYSISLDHSTSDDPTLLGGLQDNGNYFNNSLDAANHWVEMIAGGDGAFTAISDGKKYYYIETQNGNVIRLELYATGTYKSYSVVQPNHETNYLFINPYVLDPNNSNMMYYIAGDSLWRNSDLTAIPNWGESPTSVNWDVLPNTRTGNIITAVSASKTPANIVYYGTSDGQIFRLNNANVGNPIPTNVSSGLPNAYVSSIAVDMNNANNVLAVFSNYEEISLYYSTNGGSSWTAVAGNLEQNADGSGNGPSCRWASILNFNGSKTYFVATSAGLYSTNLLNGMSTNWVQESTNEIGVSVCTMVKTRDIDGTVVVATHGSGVYSAKVSTIVENVDILSENFDSETFPPNGWTQYITSVDNTWKKGNPVDNSFTSIDPTSVYSAICTWVAANQDELLYSPYLNFPQGKINLDFYVGHSTTWLVDATIVLYITLDNGANWTQLWQAQNDGAEWKWREINLDLSAYQNNSNVVLAWRYVGNDGDIIAIDNVKITGETVDVNDEIIIPNKFELSQNYPNPFNPSTTINYSILKAGDVSLKVYNIRGEVVSELVNKHQSYGNYSITFNASNLASGTYIYELKSGDNRIAKKMLLLK